MKPYEIGIAIGGLGVIALAIFAASKSKAANNGNGLQPYSMEDEQAGGGGVLPMPSDNTSVDVFVPNLNVSPPRSFEDQPVMANRSVLNNGASDNDIASYEAESLPSSNNLVVTRPMVSTGNAGVSGGSPASPSLLGRSPRSSRLLSLYIRRK